MTSLHIDPDFKLQFGPFDAQISDTELS